MSARGREGGVTGMVGGLEGEIRDVSPALLTEASADVTGGYAGLFFCSLMLIPYSPVFLFFVFFFDEIHCLCNRLSLRGLAVVISAQC